MKTMLFALRLNELLDCAPGATNYAQPQLNSKWSGFMHLATQSSNEE
jgi:hypothetical protein